MMALARARAVRSLLLASLSVTLLACGGDDGDDGVDAVDAAPPDSIPIPDASIEPDATPLYPRLHSFVPTVTARATCDAKNDAEDVCCADYDFAVQMSNQMAGQITRITKIELRVPGVVADTGPTPISCADDPWQLATGESSVEAIHIGFKYKGANDLPEVTYPCGAENVVVDLPVTILPAGDAPVGPTAQLTIEGERQGGTWASFIMDEMVDTTLPCE